MKVKKGNHKEGVCTVQYRRVPWKTRVAEKDRKGIK